MADDSYKTIQEAAEGYYTEKRSRFISFAIPVRTVEEVKEWVAVYRKKYYDARHVCWAYMLGPERKEFRANDDGEPSSTAGKPILGQINSNELTDILVIVVRYFGGIELGTSGLIVAYRSAAAEAIAAAEIIEKTVDEVMTVIFEYPMLNSVMRIVKEDNPEVLEQLFDMDCRITLRIRKGESGKLRGRLEKVDTLRFEGEEEVESR
ncbi:MAG: YigZ family protein [Tannerellaceae bacterium]|nr:YigZ family protein [Tannerellaceae bacterium]